MAAIINFIFFVIDAILGLFILCLIINAVLSWLFAFDVVNHRNRFVNGLAQAMDTITAPVLMPLRRFIPPLGGIDVTPIVAWILIAGFRTYLLPASHAAALSLVPF